MSAPVRRVSVAESSRPGHGAGGESSEGGVGGGDVGGAVGGAVGGEGGGGVGGGGAGIGGVDGGGNGGDSQPYCVLPAALQM